MPRRTPTTDGTKHVTYMTRSLPAPLLVRLKQYAAALDTTVEDALNQAVTLGLGRLERASRP